MEKGKGCELRKAGKMCESTHLRPSRATVSENDAINDNGVPRRETKLDVHAGMYMATIFFVAGV